MCIYIYMFITICFTETSVCFCVCMCVCVCYLCCVCSGTCLFGTTQLGSHFLEHALVELKCGDIAFHCYVRPWFGLLKCLILTPLKVDTFHIPVRMRMNSIGIIQIFPLVVKRSNRTSSIQAPPSQCCSHTTLNMFHCQI